MEVFFALLGVSFVIIILLVLCISLKSLNTRLEDVGARLSRLDYTQRDDIHKIHKYLGVKEEIETLLVKKERHRNE